jgi:hypothetical protein
MASFHVGPATGVAGRERQRSELSKLTAQTFRSSSRFASPTRQRNKG